MYCLLIAGMPASGKTRLAAWLAARLGLPCLSKDGIKELLFDEVGFDSRQEKVRLGRAAERVLLSFAKEQLHAGQPFIVENNFEAATWDAWHALLDGASCRAITVLLDGDVDAAYARMVARDSSPARHRGHIVNTRYPADAALPYRPPRPEDFRAGVEARGFGRFALGQVLRVDCTDVARMDYEAILRDIRALTAE